MYVQHWRLTSGCKHGKRLHAQLFPVFGIFKTNSAAPLPYPVWNFVLNRHSRWFNTWIQWMTQEASSSQLNKSRTSRCPSSTPSLCRRPVDVWNYWYTERRHTDQYLHFSSHHPLQHKLSVVRTLLDRSSHIVTEEKIESRKSTISTRLWHGVVTLTGASIRWEARCWHRRQRRPPGNESDSSQMTPSPQWLFRMCRTYQKLWAESTNATAFLQTWDHSSQYVT